MDGDQWYTVGVIGDTLHVSTNGTIDQFRSLFRLDEPVEDYVRRIVACDPQMAPLVAKFPGLRVMKPSDAVEETVSFLCTANNNMARILKMVRYLAKQGATFEKLKGWAPTRFPELEEIAELPEESLRAAGFGYRAKTIPEIAQQMVRRGGRAWLESLRNTNYESAHAELLSVTGIGPKLADCISLFGLHHSEAVPVDTHLWQASVRRYFPEWQGASLTDSRYRVVGDYYREKFGRLAGWAHQYLFYDNMLHGREYRKGRVDQ